MSSLTDKQVYDLNHMNEAARKAGLGDRMNSILVASKTLVAGDINTGVATVPVETGATVLDCFVIATSGTVRVVTDVDVSGANALVTATGVVATDTINIIYTV